jgi:hypothetical protein
MKLKTMYKAISLIFLINLLAPGAFAQWNEYSHFSDYEKNELNSSLKIDSEYFSDILTYRLPLAMESEFQRRDKIFDISVGSLSRTRFATQQRLKLDLPLTENLMFRFVHFKNEDLEKNHQVSLVELQYSLLPWLKAVTYGDFTSEKKHNDFGAAFIVNPHKDISVRTFATFSDFFFNKRTELNERDLELSKTFGVVSRWLPATDAASFLEVYSTFQTPLKRFNEDLQTQYEFSENRYGVLGRQRLYERAFLNFDVSYKRRKEGIQTSGTAIGDGIWQVHQWDTLLQFEDQRWIFGLSNHWRDWQFNSEGSQQRFFLPHLWIKGGEDSFSQDVWRFGLEMTWAYLRGSQAIIPAADVIREFEYRANFRYSIRFNENALLHLQFTGDLDEFSWEGGNGQFQIYF